MIIGGTVIGGQEVAERIGAKLTVAIAAIGRAVDREAFNLQAYIQTQKLAGQALNQRTGRLAGSINAGPLVESGGEISRKVGTNVEYAAIHEFGGNIDHPGGTPYFIERASGQAVFVSKSSQYAEGLPVTRPHRIPMPERSFLRSSLQELEPEILERIGAALEAAVND